MKVNTKILSIPPYISTSWQNIVSLHIETRVGAPVLVIGLVNGSTIEIPNLEQTTILAVFAAHEKHLEQDHSASSAQKEPLTILPEGFSNGGSAILNFPLNFGLDNNMGNLLQHNQEAADSPDLPPDMMNKIAQLSKVIGLDNLENFPKPEPHCNCMHCQIMRVMRKEEDARASQSQNNEEESEEITANDLKFREWDIQQVGEQLFLVSNPFDDNEQFNVYLGTPVGCTCGNPNCEHIRAVLNS